MVPPPTSVVLPTIDWTPAIDEVADQLGPRDELLVVCDSPTDPVAERVRGRGHERGEADDERPDDADVGRRRDSDETRRDSDETRTERVRLVVAGEPSRCSGKANAIDAGMGAAEHDRIVWTDDDFHHPPDWLSGLHDAYDRHGPVSELPYFVGRDPLAILLEPTYVLSGTLGVYLGDKTWGGAVAFERDDLDVEAFRTALRRTISDDALLSEHLDATALRRVRRVEVGGTVRDTLERHARNTQIVYRHGAGDTAVGAAVGSVLVACCLFAPVFGAVALTGLGAAVYAAFGIRRSTMLLTVPSILAFVPFMGYGLLRRTFVWGGRRYRWRKKFDVEIVE